MSEIDLRLGRWQDCLQDVTCDALICDPPYSARTDAGYRSANDFAKFQAVEHDDRNRKNRGTARRKAESGVTGIIARGRFELPYAPITEDWVNAFAKFWVPRVREWFVVFGDHVSNHWFEAALADHGLVTFAPVPWIRTNAAPRFNADGPANACEWLTIARHKGLPRERFSRVGKYEGLTGHVEPNQCVTGGKPIWLMRSLIRDYSLHGDLICDPCAGGATTLLAAAIEGRRAVGSEMDPVTHAKAMKRIAKGYTPVMFQTEREPVDPKAQESLFDGGKAVD